MMMSNGTAVGKGIPTVHDVQHEFTRHTSIKPIYCADCDSLLRGVHVQCCACKNVYHQRCASATPNVCPVILDASSVIEKNDWKEQAFKQGLLHPRTFVRYPEIAERCGFPTDSKHDFQPRTYMQPTSCTLCSKLLVGLYRQGYRCSGCNWNVHKSCRAKIPDNCVHRSVPSGEADEGGKKKGGSLQLVGPTAVRRASRRASRRIQGSSSGNSINGVVLLHVLYTQPPLRGIPGIGMILTECNEWEPELRRLHSLGLGGDIQVNCQLLAENDGDPLAVAKVLSAV